MATKSEQEKIAELENLKQKNIPDHIKKSVAEKQKHITKPLTK